MAHTIYNAGTKECEVRKAEAKAMISAKLFLFIERVGAAKMDIVVQNGHVCLGTTGLWWPSTMANDLSALLTDDLKAEIVEVFVEGDFERHEFAEFLSKEPPDTVARLWPERVRRRSSS